MKLRNILQLAGMASAFVLAVSSCSDFLDEGPKTGGVYTKETLFQLGGSVQRSPLMGVYGRYR